MEQLGISLIVFLLFLILLFLIRLVSSVIDSNVERKKGNEILTNLLTLLKSNISKDLDGLGSVVKEMLTKIKDHEQGH